MTQHTTPDFFLPADLVARALAHLMDQCHDEIDRLGRQPKQGDPDVQSETKFWLQQYRAFTKALYYWQRGLRPAEAASGGWLIPSGSRPGALVHEVSRQGGVWVCGPTCKASEHGIFHWHSALLNGIEHALELADQEDDGDPEPADEAPEPPPAEPGQASPAALGERLARARQAAAAFNDEIFGRKAA